MQAEEKPFVLVSGTPAAEECLGAAYRHRDITREQTDELAATGYGGQLDVRLVYFPWVDTSITMVGPQAHRWLLASRNRNKITTEEQRRLG